MATHTFEVIFSHSSTAPQRERKVGNIDIDQVSVVTPAMATLPERRREARMDYRRMCPYAMFKALARFIHDGSLRNRAVALRDGHAEP